MKEYNNYELIIDILTSMGLKMLKNEKGDNDNLLNEETELAVQ